MIQTLAREENSKQVTQLCHENVMHINIRASHQHGILVVGAMHLGPTDKGATKQL